MASWIDDLEEVAIRQLGLKPWELDRLTPRECQWLLEGERQRRRRVWWMVGTLGTWMMAPWSKRNLTPEKLLGWSEPFRDE